MIQTPFKIISIKGFPLFWLLTVLVVLLATGCTTEGVAKPAPTDQSHSKGQKVTSEEASNSEKINIKTVEAVLKHEYTGPDKEFIQLNENIRYASANPTEAEVAIEQIDREKVYSYVRSVYEPYFTESGLDDFMRNMGAYLRHHQNAKEVPMSIEEMDVKQSEIKTASNQYHFTAQVALETPREGKLIYEISGKAIFSEEGKIGKIQYAADSNMLLGEKLNEINNSR